MREMEGGSNQAQPHQTHRVPLVLATGRLCTLDAPGAPVFPLFCAPLDYLFTDTLPTHSFYYLFQR